MPGGCEMGVAHFAVPGFLLRVRGAQNTTDEKRIARK
jgi:hypothetical protein